jgi:quinate/shikimate dehydrogenase (NAD+)
MTSYRLGLVGSGIDMSLSPAFHRLAGERLGLDLTYELIPREAAGSGELEPFLGRLAADGYRGVNITVPFKASAWRSAATPSTDVVATGVANTLLLGTAGPTHAFNTDFSGFKWAYGRRFGSAPPGAVALLGAGGVGTATAAALVDLGATGLRIFDIVPDRSQALARLLKDRDGAVAIDVAVSAEDAVDGVDGLVNGTPVGMHWNPGMPVAPSAVGGQRWIFDAIYSPIETPLMIRAAAAGLERLTGFDLFIGQAIDAFEIFTGHRLDGPLLVELEATLEDLQRRRGV